LVKGEVMGANKPAKNQLVKEQVKKIGEQKIGSLRFIYETLQALFKRTPACYAGILVALDGGFFI
jgi:sulfur relay (sulfurtransferase) DsrC/TusE family protein